MLEIPTTPTELTPVWLTAALRQWGGAGAVTVAAVQFSPLDENEGFYGQLVRVHMTYAQDAAAMAAGAPRTLIAKLSSPTAEMRVRSVDSYRREVRFYHELAPLIAHAGPLALPACYYADINEASGWHVLLLQDLAPMRSGSRVAGCTVEQARMAVAAIAQIHLHWWGQVTREELGWVAGGDAMGDATQAAQRYAVWWQGFYEQAQHQLPTALVEPSAQLGQRSAAIRHHVFGGSTASTLIHRDYHLGNLLFGHGEVGETPGLAIVDWQFLSRGLGVWDVAYFLSENLLPDDRRRVEMEILHSYHEMLAAQGIADYPFTQCYDDYRLALLQRHTALVSTIAAMPFSPEQRHIHIDLLLPRNLAAIQDHDAFMCLEQWGAHN